MMGHEAAAVGDCMVAKECDQVQQNIKAITRQREGKGVSLRADTMTHLYLHL